MLHDLVISAIYEAIGEFIASVSSKIIGAGFDIKPKTARLIVEYVVLILIVLVSAIITFKYS